MPERLRIRVKPTENVAGRVRETQLSTLGLQFRRRFSGGMKRARRPEFGRRLDVRMAPKHHPTPLSGGDRKALTKELGKARAMTGILAAQSAEMRAKAAALIQQADKLLCESWNERMWSDGEPIDPSPTIDQAINGGFPLAGNPVFTLQDAERCRPGSPQAPADHLRARSRQPSALPQMRQGRAAPVATLLQLGWQPRHPRGEV